MPSGPFSIAETRRAFALKKKTLWTRDVSFDKIHIARVDRVVDRRSTLKKKQT